MDLMRRNCMRFLTSALMLFASAASAAMPAPVELARAATALLDRATPSDGPGAVVLIARGDKVLYRGARGMANLELGVPLAAGQVFRIGSVTKMFTAATVLKLVDSGRLSLNDPLSRFLPDYPGAKDITIHQLLNHTSGVPDYANFPDVSAAQDADTQVLIAIFRDKPLDFASGSDWAYSNSGYVLLGAVIEKVTGQDWYAAMHQQVLEPLRLRHTFFATDTPIVPGRVSGYSRGEQGQLVNAGYLTGPGADGALAASTEDLFHFMRALGAGRLLGADSFRRMTTPQPTASGKPTDYGYGMMLTKIRGVTALEHNGGISGFAAQVTYLPAAEITVVTLVNSDTYVPNAGSLGHQLAAIALGDPFPEVHPIHLSESQLRQLVGVYRVDAKGIRTLSLRNGTLYSQRGDGPARPLIPTSPDQFYFAADSVDNMTAVRDSSGNVTGLDFFDGARGEAVRQPRIEGGSLP